MNRKQKIIVSVTSIFLVLLLLVGLTYAYFLTQINGNENSKSISVTTANLALVYGDGNGIITTDEPIIPGTTLDSKTFTVKNEGNAETDYVVVIEDVKVTYATTVGENVAGTTTTFESNDFVYTLTCESDGESCSGVDTETIFPINNGILVGNKIEVGKTHTYTLTITYKETGVDQSADMNKTLEAKVNIRDIAEINPYSTNQNTLAYNIINNAVLNKNGTQLVATPPSKVAVEPNLNNWDQGTLGETIAYMPIFYANTAEELTSCMESGEGCESVEGVSEYTTCTDDLIGKYVFDVLDWVTYKVLGCDERGRSVIGNTKYEQVLSVSTDDYGASYYYRGNVQDNYVNFAGMCWKAVRVAGDGSVKLILEDKNYECDNNYYSGDWSIGSGNYGFDASNSNYSGKTITKANYLEPVTDATNSMIKAFYDFQTTTLSNKISDTYSGKTIDTMLKKGDWCIEDSNKGYLVTGQGPYTYTLMNDSVSNSQYSSLTFYYDSYRRLDSYNTEGVSPTLKCKGINLKNFKNISNDITISEKPMYVGTLTVDEVVFAGKIVYAPHFSDYLSAGANQWWTLSLYYFDDKFDYAFRAGTDIASEVVDNKGYLGETGEIVYYEHFRPSVSLTSGISITGGNGTKTNPYVVG